MTRIQHAAARKGGTIVMALTGVALWAGMVLADLWR